MDDKSEKIANFIEITNAKPVEAKAILEKNDYDLANSIDEYLQNLDKSREVEKECHKIKLEPEIEGDPKNISDNNEANKLNGNKPKPSAYFPLLSTLINANEPIKKSKEDEIRKPLMNPSLDQLFPLPYNNPPIRGPHSNSDQAFSILLENRKNVQSQTSFNYDVERKKFPENRSSNDFEQNENHFLNSDQKSDQDFRNPFLSPNFLERENSRLINNDDSLEREMRLHNFHQRNSFPFNASNARASNKCQKNELLPGEKNSLKKDKRKFSANIDELKEKLFCLDDKKEIYDKKNLLLIFDDLSISQKECKWFFTNSKQRAFFLLLNEIKIFAIDGRRCVLLNIHRRQQHFVKNDFVINNKIPEFYSIDNYNHIKNYMSKFEHLHLPIGKKRYAIKKRNKFLSKTNLQEKQFRFEKKNLEGKK